MTSQKRALMLLPLTGSLFSCLTLVEVDSVVIERSGESGDEVSQILQRLWNGRAMFSGGRLIALARAPGLVQPDWIWGCVDVHMDRILSPPDAQL